MNVFILNTYLILIIVCGIFRWDLSLIHDLPDYIKIAFQFFLNIADELIFEIVKSKGGISQP